MLADTDGNKFYCSNIGPSTLWYDGNCGKFFRQRLPTRKSGVTKFNRGCPSSPVRFIAALPLILAELYVVFLIGMKRSCCLHHISSLCECMCFTRVFCYSWCWQKCVSVFLLVVLMVNAATETEPICMDNEMSCMCVCVSCPLACHIRLCMTMYE